MGWSLPGPFGACRPGGFYVVERLRSSERWRWLDNKTFGRSGTSRGEESRAERGKPSAGKMLTGACRATWRCLGPEAANQDGFWLVGARSPRSSNWNTNSAWRANGAPNRAVAERGLAEVASGARHLRHQVTENKRWLHLATRLEEPDRADTRERPRAPVTDVAAPLIGDGEVGVPAPAYAYFAAFRRGSEPYALARVHVAKEIYARPRSASPADGLCCAGGDEGRADRPRASGLVDQHGRCRSRPASRVAISAPTAEARCIVTDANVVVLYLGEVDYPGEVMRLNIELIDRRRR